MRKKRSKKMTDKQRRATGLPVSLSLSPQSISEDAWYYEERKGLHLVVWDQPIAGHTRKVQNLTIPWRQLRGTMARYGRYLKRRASTVSGEHSA